MALPTGTRLGPYEILGPLGAGGMGEVYSARDGRLDRAVAIKVLPEHLASDPRLRQRFEREARALAALSHPHICTLHDVGEQDGVSFLVMERLEGETLAARLAKGALPLSEVTRVGSQIAAALDQAHRRGVVHRDLKPANVMLTRAGAKLLDFGLARPAVDVLASPAGDLTRLPTESQPLTTNQEIVGTIPYMAPEQLEGREPDTRTDIFALGAVLHEMATGRRAFGGESMASVIAAILTAEPPPLSSLAPLAPAALERAVSRCLAKDPESRWQSARDLQLELDWIDQAGGGAEASAARASRSRIPERLAWLAAVGALAVALGLAIARLDGPAPAPLAAARFTVAPPAGLSYTFARVSPDGRHLSFTALGAGDRSQIWLRPLEDPAARPLPGTEGAGRHFWSPDSRYIAFFAEGKLKRVEVTGGPSRVLCEAPGAGPFRQGAWGRDGTILFRVDEAPGHREGLFRVPASGGAPAALDPIDESGRKMQAGWPSFLPDGRRFLAACNAEGDATQRAGICVITLETGHARRLLDIPSYAEYAPPGFLLYVEGTSLSAQPFDAESLRLSGEPKRIADGMESWAGIGVPSFSVSTNGVLVHQGLGGQARLLWKDRSGGDLGEAGPRGIYEYVRLAPDGRRAVATLRHPQHGVSELWIVDLERRVSTRFTPESPDALFPVWSPDGSRMAYCRPRNGPPSLHVKSLSGGADRVLLPSAGSMQCASDWSSDGRHLLFTERHPGTGMDIWLLATDSARPPTPLVRTSFRELSASFSPDTRWVAYTSDESGQPEVYVQPFPGPGERIRVSVEGGTLPRWRRDGGELYYLDSSERLVAVPVGPGPTPRVGAPAPLFRFETGGSPDVAGRYDVSADGQRFLVIAPESAAAPGATVVLDWPAALVEAGRD
jgi:Tol biopolymer transport system component